MTINDGATDNYMSQFINPCLTALSTSDIWMQNNNSQIHHKDIFSTHENFQRKHQRIYTHN